jgi:hypothetical protein
MDTMCELVRKIGNMDIGSSVDVKPETTVRRGKVRFI